MSHGAGGAVVHRAQAERRGHRADPIPGRDSRAEQEREAEAPGGEAPASGAVVQQVSEGDWGIVPSEYLMDETPVRRSELH